MKFGYFFFLKKQTYFKTPINSNYKMDSHINYNKKFMAEKIKDKLFSSMVRYRNINTSKRRSNLNPNAVNTPSSLSSSHNMKSITNHTINEKKNTRGKLEYELRILVGHAMVLDRLVEEIDQEENASSETIIESDCDTLVDDQNTVTCKLQDSDDSDEDSDEELTYHTYENYKLERNQDFDEDSRYFTNEDIAKLNMRQQQYMSSNDCKMSSIEQGNNSYQDINIMIS